MEDVQKLLVKFVDAPSVAGGKAAVLCDERGVVLPAQIETKLEFSFDGPATITVTFVIAGDEIRIEN